MWESGGVALPFLTSILDGGEWSASRPGRYIPGTYGVGDWVGLRAALEAVKERQSCPAGN
jgi:hypothetical protein